MSSNDLDKKRTSPPDDDIHFYENGSLIVGADARESVHSKQGKCNPPRKLKGFNRRYHDETEPPSSDEESLNKYNNLKVPPGKEKAKMITNPPTYVFLTGDVKVCSWCKVHFTQWHRTPPNNLIFTFRTIRTWPDPNTKWMKSLQGPVPCYYHAHDLDCLKKVHELEHIKKHDLYIQEKTWKQLTPNHLSVHSCNHLKHLRQACAELMWQK